MAQRSFDVVALGELLIDFTENEVSDQGNPIFEANPGGAPCNVLATLARLGKKPLSSARWGRICLTLSFGRWPSRRASAWTR